MSLFSTPAVSSVGQQLFGGFFSPPVFIECLAPGSSGPRLILKFYDNANYNFKLDMSAVILLAVKVINIDLGILFDFVK